MHANDYLSSVEFDSIIELHEVTDINVRFSIEDIIQREIHLQQEKDYRQSGYELLISISHHDQGENKYHIHRLLAC